MTPPFQSEARFFEAKYRQSPDPWGFEKNSYELGRYAAILGSLDGRRYRSAVEPGCSIGVLTEQLGGICDQVLAFDFSETAARMAAARCQRLPQVEVRCSALDDAFDFAGFDLVVFSEIGYYFEKLTLERMVARMTAQLAAGTTLVAAHWLGSSPDHELSGDDVHEILAASSELQLRESKRYADFRLENWTRR